MAKEEQCMIQTRISKEVKEEAEEVLDALGLTISDAVRIFLKQVCLRSCIPFDIKVPEVNENTIIAVKGKDGTKKLVKVEDLK
ncbi:MAG: type II toxin-antitoxin system RelB/DinJ family antitoxin [Clostridia bacterium]|nr:type II toxin-antitoxin system RelB/DinJ family antitoxin [Clostridia bacterium]